MAHAELLFLDTSVQVARVLSGPAQRARVIDRGAGYRRCSSLVCRQEFKRRVLKDAEYLLRVLDERKGYESTFDYMTRLIQNPHHKRRASICLSLLKRATGDTDQEKADRLRSKLRTFLLAGLSQFDAWLDELAAHSGCACGRSDVSERKLRTGRVVFEFGEDKCQKLPTGLCGVVAFLASRAGERAAIRAHLASLPLEKKSAELKEAEAFLAAIDADPNTAPGLNPCLSVGDLIIALESVAAGATAVYTMNGRESQHLCRALGQTLIVRSPDEQKDDVVCPRDQTATWHDFGPS